MKISAESAGSVIRTLDATLTLGAAAALLATSLVHMKLGGLWRKSYQKKLRYL